MQANINNVVVDSIKSKRASLKLKLKAKDEINTSRVSQLEIQGSSTSHQ